MIPRIIESRHRAVGLFVVIALVSCSGDPSFDGRSADDWARLLHSSDPRERQAAAVAFLNAPPHEVTHVRPLLLAASDLDSVVRRQAAQALVRLPPKASKLLVAQLRDTNVAIRRAAALALGHFRDDRPDAIRALSKATEDSDDSVRTLAVLSLGERSSGARDALPRIMYLAMHPGPQRAAALMVLPNIDTESRSLLPPYYAALDDTSPAVRAAAVSMLLPAGGDRDVTPMLVKALGDTDARVRHAAVAALALVAHHDSVAYAAMAASTKSPDPVVRRIADSVLRADAKPR